MLCKKCGAKNSDYSRHCIKCGENLLEIDNSEYCPNCNNPLLLPNSPCPYCTNSQRNPEKTYCNMCKVSIRRGLIFSNAGRLNDFERLILDKESTEDFCDKCLQLLKNKASGKLKDLKNKFQEFLDKIPVLSVENPGNLTVIKYCGIVTSQAIVKVDLLRETNNKKILNIQNSDLEYKLKSGENSCILSLKKEALKLGANAIVKCDINYGELGGEKYNFLIGMMGTAVIVEEFNILTDYEQNIYNYLTNSVNYKDMFTRNKD